MRMFVLMCQVPSTSVNGLYIRLPDAIATVFVPAMLRLPSTSIDQNIFFSVDNFRNITIQKQICYGFLLLGPYKLISAVAITAKQAMTAVPSI